MTCDSKYVYRIELNSASAIREFTRIASNCKYEVNIVNGRHRLSAKSFLGVMLAKISWDEIYIESDTDCYYEFEKFIVG